MLLAVAASTPLIVAIVGLRRGWVAAGDDALISLRVSDLVAGHLPLTGLPTSGETFGSGVASSHPGPVLFYVLAPFHAAFGADVGLVLGAATINACAWAVSVHVMATRWGIAIGALTLTAHAALACSLDPGILYDPLSSNIGTFPSIAALLVAADVLAGSWRRLPVLVILVSLAAQAHVTYLASSALVASVILVALARRSRLADRPGGGIVTAIGLAAVLWFPVVWDQAFATGNLSSLVQTFTSEGSVGQGFGFAFSRLVHAMAPIPPFLRAPEQLGQLSTTPTVAGWFGGASIAALALILAHALRHERPSRHVLALVCATAAVSVVSAAQLPGDATLKAANLRWMWTLGALSWLAAGAWAVDRRPSLARSPHVRQLAMILAIAAVTCAVTVNIDRPVRDEPTFATVRALRSDVGAVLDRGGYLVSYSGEAALLTVGPALVSTLVQSGFDLRVPAGSIGRAYGVRVGRGDWLAGRSSMLIMTLREGLGTSQQTSPPSGSRLIADARYDPDDGGPDVLVRIYVADARTTFGLDDRSDPDPASADDGADADEATTPSAEGTCARMVELTDQAITRHDLQPFAEELDARPGVVDEWMDGIGPWLNAQEERRVRSLLAMVPSWYAEMVADPTISLEEVTASDQEEISTFLLLLELCDRHA